MRFELPVRVPAIVPQKAQPAAFKRHDQVRIAVAVHIEAAKGRNGPELFHAELDLLEAAAAQVAPNADTIPRGNNVQPAIVVIIHQAQLTNLEITDWDRDAILQFVED